MSVPPLDKLRLIPLAEAATELRIAPVTLRGWLLAGRIPYHRIGRQLMVLQSDLDSFVRSSRVAV
jgi:excisionase family DNA binding protein